VFGEGEEMSTSSSQQGDPAKRERRARVTLTLKRKKKEIYLSTKKRVSRRGSSSGVREILC